VNGVALTSPLVVMQLQRSLRDDSQATRCDALMDPAACAG
jgi:hypothetical protein